MRWRRENAFCKAHEYLKHLHGEPEDLGALWELQILLLDEILFQEEKIRSLKTRLRKSEASLNSLSRAAAFFIQRRIEECRFWNYVWRCFGDGIAFSYMDRFALKQTLYNVENMGPKQGAGFIGGKDGLKHELDTVASALRDGIPALLTDLTNTVRHGDVCLMAGPDPILLEAKSGKIIDRRGKKQRKRIHSLHAFFRKDFAQTLRGLKHVRRTEFTVPPVTYLQQINDCIEAANTVGYATGKPEEGLHYVVCTRRLSAIHDIFDNLHVKQPMIFTLNEIKNSQSWSPYYPFTLSIYNQRNLYDFIQGRITITVLYDLAVTASKLAEAGLTAIIDQKDFDYPIKINKGEGERSMSISRHLLGRIGLDFLSPQCLIDMSIELLDKEMAAAPNPED